MKLLSILIASLFSLPAFSADKLGSRRNPIKVSMVPSQDATKILTGMQPLSKCLEKETGYFFDVNVPNNFIVVVEGMGAKRVDIAFLNTFGYLLAHQRFGAEAMLKMSRNGETTYKAQIIVRTDSPIKKLSDLNGKRVAYVDPASTSGYILPKMLFMKHDVKPKEEVFAGKHDSVVTMVYQGKQVDAGATFYSPPIDGAPQDARKHVKTQFPDVLEKVRILELSEAIPNDPIVVRKDLSKEMKDKVKTGMEKCVKTNKDAFMAINNSDGLAPVLDKDYDTVRKTVQALKMDLGTALKK